MNIFKNSLSTKNLSLYTLIVLIFFLLSIKISTPFFNPIIYDAFGYYLYLPFTFIYHDLGLNDSANVNAIFDLYHPSTTFYQANPGPLGGQIMKYSAGMAILYSPFFFISHFIAGFTDYAQDGFSKPYQIGLLISGVFYSILGLVFLRKILLRYFSDSIVAITIILIFLATNYYSYSVYNGLMPHNYLFTLYALIIWFCIKWYETYKWKYSIFLAICIGISVLARPTEIISLLIPLLWGISNRQSIKDRIISFRKNYKQLIGFTLIIISIGLIQVIYWKIYSGQFIFYSYKNPGEGFEFLSPYVLKVLFSFRKGWLIYTPLMFFALWGFYYLYKFNRDLFYSIFIFSLINLYIVSSWSNWWYAQSFGQRALIQSYPLLSFPLAAFITRISYSKKRIKWTFVLLLSFILFLNLFQVWQLRNAILDGDRMTFAYYKKVFLKTKVDEKDKKLLLVDRDFRKKLIIPDDIDFKITTLLSMDFENYQSDNANYYSSEKHYSGNQSLKIDSTVSYFSSGLNIPFEKLTDKDYAWIRVKAMVYIEDSLADNSLKMVITFHHEGKVYKYRNIEFGNPTQFNLKANEWNELSYDYLTPEVRSKDDNLKVYFWNRGKGIKYIDDWEITKYEPIDQ